MAQRELVIYLRGRDYCAPEILAEIGSIAPGARILTEEDIQRDPAAIERVEVALGWIPRDLWPRARALRWLHTTGAGADWTQRPELRAHLVVVTNAHIHATPISEHLFGLLLALTRGLHLACRNQQQRRWSKEGPDALEVLAGKTLCVLGLGTVGRRCAELGAAFGMRVIGVRNHPAPTPHVEQVFGPGALREALAQADVIMNVLPGTRQTYRFIGAAEFGAMRRGVYFLNAGRGRTVDTDALVEALANGAVKGAGLDVVDPEPLPPDHPLWAMPNVLISPHNAGLHPDYAKNVAAIFLRNLRRYVAGEPLESVVDKEKGY